MKLFFYLIGIVIAAYVFDRFCLWLERKGWLYYRHNKPKKGIIGTALQELNAQLLPSHRHIVVAKEEKVQSKKAEKDLPIHGNTEMSNLFADKIKKAYDKIAKTWYEKREWYIEQTSIDEMIAKLHSGATVLDVGCGSGKPIAAYLKSHGFEVYGMDISPKQIEYAKQIIPEKNLFVADICDFSTSMRFDAIICWCTLFHIHASQHGIVLKKLHALLKSEGLLLITFADTTYPPEGEFKIIDESTIESEMFGEYFYHSGQPSQRNSQLVLNTGFIILSDKIDQPGNQVILAKRETGYNQIT